MVFFEAPHRTAASLAAMSERFGTDRRAALCRELTKTHEEVRRGTLAELAEWATAAEIRGEVTLVVAGRTAPDQDLAPAAAEVRDLLSGGMQLKPAVAQVAKDLGVSKNRLYEQVLRGGD
jgi:16S rRNA (cytidine1402-2'-O)-methyltransferase